jgi:hypothetical protein
MVLSNLGGDHFHSLGVRDASAAFHQGLVHIGAYIRFSRFGGFWTYVLDTPRRQSGVLSSLRAQASWLVHGLSTIVVEYTFDPLNALFSLNHRPI